MTFVPITIATPVPEGTPVLVWHSLYKEWTIVTYYDDDEFGGTYYDSDHALLDDPEWQEHLTHWTRLPPPPVDGAQAS